MGKVPKSSCPQKESNAPVYKSCQIKFTVALKGVFKTWAGMPVA